VQKIAIASALEALRMTPTATDIDVSRLDGIACCKCPVCKALNDENHSEAATQLTLVNAVAEAVAREYPGVLVSTIAYGDAGIAPTKLKPRDNVLVRLCNDTHSWKYPLLSFTEGDAPETVQYRKAIQDWSAISKQMAVWEYTSNYSHYPAPMPNMHILAPELKYYIEHKVTSMMLQGDYNGPHSDRATMRMWVMGKLMWNPSLDTEALVRDFNYGHYGKAAAPIQEYDELLNEVGKPYFAQILPNGIRYPMTVGFFTKDFMARSLALMEQAEALAKEDPILLNRVQIAKLPIQYVMLSRRKDFSTEQYAATLDEFKRVARANKLAYLAEPPGPDLEQKLAFFDAKLRGRLAPRVPLPEEVKAKVPPGTEAENVIDVLPDEFSLWYQNELVFVEDDATAPGGKTTRTAGNTKMWTVQYPLKDIDDLNDDLWRCYVVARAESKAGAPKTGDTLNCGIYDGGTRSWTVESHQKLADVSDNKYRVIDLGAHKLRNESYVYVTPTDNANVANIYVARIILVREPKTQ
jgi:hypothetical protein